MTAMVMCLVLLMLCGILALHLIIAYAQIQQHKFSEALLRKTVEQTLDRLGKMEHDKTRVSNWCHKAIDLIKRQQARIEELERKDSADVEARG